MLDEVDSLDVAELTTEQRLSGRALQVKPAGKAWLAVADGVAQIEALRDGAAGVVSASAGAAEYAAALDAIRKGHAVLPPGLLRTLLPASSNTGDGPSLTPREASVLALLSEGATNKMIARRLDISVHTAKFHVASILGKLDATTRTDAVAQGVRQGLLML